MKSSHFLTARVVRAFRPVLPALIIATASCSDRPTQPVLAPGAPTLDALVAGSTEGLAPVSGDSYVATDKSDYQPGENVVVTGGGWQPGETVVLEFVESPLVHAPDTLEAVADERGLIENSEYLLEEHDLGQSFTLNAKGQSSGFQASAEFTDSHNSSLSISVTSASDFSPGSSPGVQDVVWLMVSSWGSQCGTNARVEIVLNSTNTLVRTIGVGGCGQSAPWDGRNNSGGFVSDGVYKATIIWQACNLGCFTRTGNSVFVTVDNSPPTGSVGIGANPRVGVQTTLSGNVSDNGSGMATAGLTITRLSDGMVLMNSSIGSSAFFIPYTPTEASAQKAAVSATDRAGNTSTLAFTFTVCPAAGCTVATSTTVTTQPASSTYGQLVTITATVAAASGTPTGSVAFYASGSCSSPGTSLGTQALNAGQAKVATATLGAGTHSLVACFTDGTSFGTSSGTKTFSVAPAPLQAKAVDVTRTYGAANPNFTASYSGFVLGQTASVVTGTPDLSSDAVQASDAGTYHITWGTPSGITAPNYAITYVGGTLTVAPAPLTVTVASAQRQYGLQNPALSCTVSGVISPDQIGISSCQTTAAQASPVGRYPITATLADPGSRLANYAVTNPGGTLTITPAPLVITVVDQQKVFDGRPNAFTVTYSPFVLGQDASVLSGTLGFTIPGLGDATQVTAVSPNAGYSVTARGVTSGNYDITFAPGVLRILPWSLAGFYQPVDMSTGAIVYNSAKAGSTVPLKFNVYQAYQTNTNERSDAAAIKSFTQQEIACSGAALQDDIELYTTGGTSLRYDSVARQFVQNWQTPRTAGKCYRVVMTTLDGSTMQAFFMLK
jgi:hypothetical protein